MDLDSNQVLVLEVIQQASSQIPEIFKPAEAKLKEWETQPGFYPVLIRTSTCATDANVRLLAMMYLKNGMDKYWSAQPSTVISEEEKRSIRQELLSNFTEPVHQIAMQKALLISKLARLDYPKDWSELFPTLLAAVENPSDVIQHRSLLTLHYVVKALACKPHEHRAEAFRKFTIEIYGFILNLWNGYTEAFVRDIFLNASAQEIAVNLVKSLLALRILKKLTVFGFCKPHEYVDCVTFMKAAFERTHTGLQCRKQLESKDAHVFGLCEKFVVNTTKVLLAVLDGHPYSFIDFIQPALELTFHCLFTEEGIRLVFERFVVQCFNIIGEILQRFEYKIIKRIEKPETTRAQQIIKAFFQPHVVLDMCKKMVGHYFILTQAELDSWDADPEEFAKEESELSWKYSLRLSVEQVFVTVFHEFKDCLIPFLRELVASTNVSVPPEDMQGILKKDAAYNAISMCSSDVIDEAEFNKWFTKTIMDDLLVKHANYRVIRRRAITLVGYWTESILPIINLRLSLYDCINNLLMSSEDMAVRLAAASTLSSAVLSSRFTCDEHFETNMNTAFALLFVSLEEARECGTKMQILKVMTFLIEKMSNTAKLQLDSVVHYIPCLWKEAQEHNMLRCAIVSSLVQIVKALGVVKPEVQSLVVSILDFGTDTSQSANVYLLEYSLDLWLIALRYSPAMTEEFMRLFERMPSLLSYSTETLRKCLTICSDQVLLAPEVVIRTSGPRIVQVCTGLVSGMKDEEVVMFVRVFETFIIASPLLGTETLLPVLPKIFEKLFSCCSKNLSWLEAKTLRIVARVLLSSQETFSQVVVCLAGAYNENELGILGRILDVWLSKMKHVYRKAHKKLLALALASLLTTRSDTVLDRICPILLNIKEALKATTSIADDGTMTESLVDYKKDVKGYYENDHERRSEQLILSDPVHRIILSEYVRSQFSELRNQLGEQQFRLLLQTVNVHTLSRLRHFKILL